MMITSFHMKNNYGLYTFYDQLMLDALFTASMKSRRRNWSKVRPQTRL